MTYEELTYLAQVVHGHRAEIDIVAKSDDYLSDCFSFAKKYQLRNVIQILEQRLIMRESRQNFKTIIAYDLNHQLAIRLRSMKSSKELAKKLKHIKIQNMSGEAMKQCVKFFVEH
uniref:BTB domain-containing protein n=1 Tax=Caenorhabditis tropicalis TaxID=1561998 RepID=A0A1I7UKR8_9PELO